MSLFTSSKITYLLIFNLICVLLTLTQTKLSNYNELFDKRITLIDSNTQKDNNVDESTNIYWKVTEHGLVYCKKNCLFESSDDNNTNQTEAFDKSTNNATDAVTSSSESISGSGSSSSSTLATPTTTTTTTTATLLFDMHNEQPQIVLECLPYTNHTVYDNLLAIATRYTHKNVPEPELIAMFEKNGEKNVNMDELMMKLLKLKEQKPNSVNVYNKIGNFFRVQGNTLKAIECFRKALHIDPQNSYVLLNLARLLFKLKYYDDAIELTRKSLEYARNGQTSWLQHFTLAEILKMYGFQQEAVVHFHYTLKLKPNYKPAIRYLKEIEQNINQQQQSQLSVSYHTFILIFLLIACVLCGILSLLYDANTTNETTKTTKPRQKSIERLANNNNNNDDEAIIASKILSNPNNICKRTNRHHQLTNRSSSSFNTNNRAIKSKRI